MMNDIWRQDLSQAREIHRAGQLDTARAAYEVLLRTAPEDSDVRGLLGVLALQEGRLGDAEVLLRQAVTDGGEARIVLRNLNNLLALLQQRGDTGAARALVAGDLPDWPNDTVPEPSERQTLLSLCRALLLLDRAAAARRLLDQAFPAPQDDPEAHGVIGRTLLALGEHAPAAAALQCATAEPDADPQTLIALSYAQSQLGQSVPARATLDQITRRWPIYEPSPRPSQRAAILVLNPTPKKVSNLGGGLSALHFAANFPNQFAAEFRAEFRFPSIFADLAAIEQPHDLPSADVILNNVVDPEMMNVPGRLDRVIETMERAGAPVINHPRAVFDTTRQKVAALLAGIPNLKIPRIERYRADLTPAAEIAVDIEDRFAYPVIIRQCQAHMSARVQHSDNEAVAVLAEDGTALRDYLTTLGWPEVYAIEYVALRQESGQFRKIRAVLAEDEVIVAIPGYGSDWMVGGGPGNPNWVDYYRAHPEAIVESREIVLDPERLLGTDCMRTLEAIRDRMPLDFCGVDFDVDDAGQVVFFEANAAMNILKRPNEPEDQTLPDEPFDRIKAAFRRAVDRRIGGVAS